MIILVLPFASIGGVLISYIRNLRGSGMAQRDAIVQGAKLRFRPVMMTASVAALGLITFLFAKGPLLTLIVLPTLYRFFDDIKVHERTARKSSSILVPLEK